MLKYNLAIVLRMRRGVYIVVVQLVLPDARRHTEIQRHAVDLIDFIRDLFEDARMKLSRHNTASLSQGSDMLHMHQSLPQSSWACINVCPNARMKDRWHKSNVKYIKYEAVGIKLSMKYSFPCKMSHQWPIRACLRKWAEFMFAERRKVRSKAARATRS